MIGVKIRWLLQNIENNGISRRNLPPVAPFYRTIERKSVVPALIFAYKRRRETLCAQPFFRLVENVS